MNVLLADGPITQSKSPTRKFCLPENSQVATKLASRNSANAGSAWQSCAR